MSDNNYFNSNEKTDFELFEEFNNRVNKFENVKRMPRGHWSDVTATTTDKKWNIELKSRKILLLDDGRVSGHSETNGRDYIYDGIMIESHKYADLILDRIIGLEPLYINFLMNCMIIYDLSKLTVRPKRYRIPIYSKGYQTTERTPRQILDIKDALILSNDDKVLKRPGEEWKGWNKAR